MPSGQIILDETMYKQLTIFDLMKPKPVDIRGICDDGYCPTCGIWIDDLIPSCPHCKTILDWTHWKRLNEGGTE